MSVLLKAYDEHGNSAGTCGAHCYDAKTTSSADCKCICRGVNHGAGLSQASLNAYDIRDEYLKSGVLPPGVVRIDVEEQMLFPEIFDNCCKYMTAQA